MSEQLRAALDRTLLLMRDDVVAPDNILIDALTKTTVALVADRRNISSNSAQSAYITTALLMARSGHRVYLAAPDVPFLCAQAPLKSTGIVSSLMEIGDDLLPGIRFSTVLPDAPVDLEITLGDSPEGIRARRHVSICTGVWSANLVSRGKRQVWPAIEWPFGGMAAGGLAASEAFKISMRKLRHYARSRSFFDCQFAPVDSVDFELAPSATSTQSDLGDFDLISAGAICNGALYALCRIPNVNGRGRVLDDDTNDLSNLNRNMLLRRSMLGEPKVDSFSRADLGGLKVEGLPARFNGRNAQLGSPLARRILVGVDDIKARWDVQQAAKDWVGVGATTHWSAMSSSHPHGQPCAGCLHPRDDPENAAIPTVAFVSFEAGLLLATDFIRSLNVSSSPARAHQVFVSPLRPEAPWRSPVAFRDDCPLASLH